MLTDIPAYGPTRELPGNYRYVGPVFWEPPLPIPSFVEQLDRKRPTVYVTMGSSGKPEFFDHAIRVFGNTEWQCIITTAGLAKIDAPPKNVFVVDFAPGSALMRVSDVVVCQGGTSTVYQALAASVPIVGLPTLHDHDFNLDRVEALGCGVRISDSEFEPSMLRDAVEKLRNDGGYRARAGDYARMIAEYDGPRSAAKLIAAM